jgi:hypothetical protein
MIYQYVVSFALMIVKCQIYNISLRHRMLGVYIENDEYYSTRVMMFFMAWIHFL